MRKLLLLLLFPLIAQADFVRDDSNGWEGGSDQALDLTNAGDGLVIVVAADEGTDHADLHQGTAAIDTVSPIACSNGTAISNGTSGHLETYFCGTGSKTGSTTIDIDQDATWHYYALLAEGYDSSALSDSCAVEMSATPNYQCSLTVPANGFVACFAHTIGGAVVSNWNGMTFREEANGASPTTVIWAGTQAVVSATTANFGPTFTTNENGSIHCLAFAEANAQPTVSLDTASQAAGSTWVGTLSTSLAGGNPTKAVLGTGDEVTCDSATSTTCTFTLPLAQFSNTGTLNNTPWSATTVKLSDGTNESQTAALTIAVPSMGLMVDLACTAGVNCDTGSEADSPMTTNDDCAVVVNSGSALSALTTHCQPYFAGPTSNYTVYQFDESATAWLEQDTVNLTAGCTSPIILDVLKSILQSVVRDPVCQ